jgi:predicted DNA-binding transcriptional regulator YafY
MYGLTGKKMINICILEILRKYTDCDHTMEQKDIINKLKSDYGLEVERKSIKANLIGLIDMGYDIDYSETTRKKANGETEIMMTDWHYNHEFNDAELRIMIDSILFSKNISTSQAQTLIDKISNLSNIYFSAKVKHVKNLPELVHTDNKQVLLNVEMIDDAISQGKKIAFIYNSYGKDKRLHPKKSDKYLVNPYQMAACNGRYYLICNLDKYDNISNYRIDKMTELEILDENVKPKNRVKGMEQGFNLPRHMAEQLFMFSDESRNIVMKLPENHIGNVVDWFGNKFDVISTKFAEKNYGYNPESEPGMVYVKVSCSPMAMSHWAMLYGETVEVVSPPELRESIRQAAEDMLNKYQG